MCCGVALVSGVGRQWRGVCQRCRCCGVCEWCKCCVDCGTVMHGVCERCKCCGVCRASVFLRGTLRGVFLKKPFNTKDLFG